MIGLDTNVLVRLMTSDDAGQASRVRRLLEMLTSANPGFISIVAAVETFWVLGDKYRFSDEQIVDAFHELLAGQNVVAEDEEDFRIALMMVRDGRGDFGDILVAAAGLRAGCTHTATFDKKAQRLPGFAAVP